VSAVPDAEEMLELFTFSVGPHRYAVDLPRVDEVLPPTELTPSSSSGGLVVGSVPLRGERIPVVDLRRCLPSGPAGAAAPRFLVCWLGRRRVAFFVDAVGGVVRLQTASLRPGPGGAAVSPAVVAVSAEVTGDHFLLDLRELLRRQSPPAPGAE
jgi:purine-binding chemotaxis protein CheW